MNNFFLRMFSLLIVLLCLVSAAGAASVLIENDTLLVKGVNDSIGLGAFNVVLTYGGNVSIQSVEGESGFMVASNIQNKDFQTFIAGISTEGLTGDIPVASVIATGVGDIDISVRELTNVNGYSISYTNEDFTGSVPTPSSDKDVTIPGMSGSQTGGSFLAPSATPVPTAEATVTIDSTVTAVETPVNSSVDGGGSEEQTIIGNQEESVTNMENATATQSPLCIMVILISIGSIYIFKKKE